MKPKLNPLNGIGSYSLTEKEKIEEGKTEFVSIKELKAGHEIKNVLISKDAAGAFPKCQ
ncbi:MAG: hypothetical protein GY749_13390 [Desulfobacteraceae bacterium]|nr:hypothetical protein [Desulfobacteraceae bacterium]